MKAVHELTTAEAALELEQLLDIKPSEEQPLALHRWNEVSGQRAAELQAWLLMHSTPAPKEAPMPAPKTPEEKLATIKERFLRHSQGDARSLAAFDARALCKKHSLPVPDWAAKKVSAPKEKAAPKPIPDPPACDGESTTEPLPYTDRHERKYGHPVMKPEDWQRLVSRTRATIWRLMAELEDLPVDLRAALVPELALLDAAAHTAHTIALGVHAA